MESRLLQVCRRFVLWIMMRGAMHHHDISLSHHHIYNQNYNHHEPERPWRRCFSRTKHGKGHLCHNSNTCCKLEGWNQVTKDVDLPEYVQVNHVTCLYYSDLHVIQKKSVKYFWSKIQYINISGQFIINLSWGRYKLPGYMTVREMWKLPWRS